MKYSRAERDFEEFGILFDSPTGQTGSKVLFGPKSSRTSTFDNSLAWRNDALVVRLINGGKTLLHAVHWPAFLSLAQGCEEWQLTNLCEEGRTIWELTREAGILYYPDIPVMGMRSTQSYIQQLEALLLVNSPRLAGEEDLIESWGSWSLRVGVEANMSAEEARQYFEDLLIDTRKFAGNHPFPWSNWQEATTVIAPLAATVAVIEENAPSELDDHRGEQARFSCQRADNSLHHLSPVGSD